MQQEVLEAKLYEALQAFPPVTLAGMEAVTLQNRVDSKFFFPVTLLPEILSEITEQYQILEIDGKRMFAYESLYFDTPDFLLYRHHHNGRTNRLKVRYRKYLDSGITYFEVKHRIKDSRTEKYRIRKTDIATTLTTDDMQKVHLPFVQIPQLLPSLFVYFQRITLVRIGHAERATIDVHLRFVRNEEKLPLEELCIVEIKQEKNSVLSPLFQTLKHRLIHEQGFSKYAIGMAALAHVKYNTFKPVLLKINQLRNGNS